MNRLGKLIKKKEKKRNASFSSKRSIRNTYGEKEIIGQRGLMMFGSKRANAFIVKEKALNRAE